MSPFPFYIHMAGLHFKTLYIMGNATCSLLYAVVLLYSSEIPLLLTSYVMGLSLKKTDTNA